MHIKLKILQFQRFFIEFMNEAVVYRFFQDVFIGEIGIRASMQYWKMFKNVRSKLWDIDGLRHIIKPYANAAVFSESDDVVKQKDIFSFGLLQCVFHVD